MSRPTYAVEYVFYVSLVSRASRPQFQANPTLAIGDVKICRGDGAAANLATLPEVDVDFTTRVKVTVSATEMTESSGKISLHFLDASGAEWDDLMVHLDLDMPEGEPGQGAPPESATWGQKINYLYKFLINKQENTGAQNQVYEYAASQVDHKATTGKSGGTSTRGQYISGP